MPSRSSRASRVTAAHGILETVLASRHQGFDGRAVPFVIGVWLRAKSVRSTPRLVRRILPECLNATAENAHIALLPARQAGLSACVAEREQRRRLSRRPGRTAGVPRLISSRRNAARQVGIGIQQPVQRRTDHVAHRRKAGRSSQPIDDERIFSAATAYPGDEKTETLILLDEGLFRGRDTLALDVWLLDRASEPELFSTIGRILVADEKFQVIAEMVAALDHFPDHKIAITLRSARIRAVEL